MPATLKNKNLMRMLLVVAAFMCWQGAPRAAECAADKEQRKNAEPIIEWYENYIRPYRYLAGSPVTTPTKSQVETFIDEISPFHRRAVLDQLIFEALISQIMTSYAREPDFRGIDTAAVDKIYRTGTGQKLDFSFLCISPKTVRSRDDAFAITLFGVVEDDCQHIGLRGLVFTAALVNGSANGQCKPDQFYRKMFILPLPAGTNEITYICGKDRGGCARQ